MQRHIDEYIMKCILKMREQIEMSIKIQSLVMKRTKLKNKMCTHYVDIEFGLKVSSVERIVIWLKTEMNKRL